MTEKKIKVPQITEAKHSAEKLKAIAFLLKDELEYFKDSTPEVREILKEYLPGPTIGYIASLLTALYDENQLEITGFPVLFIKGGNSDYILDEDKKAIQQIFPYAKIETIPNAGHWLHAEQPELFLQKIEDFILQ